jgi:hypothetical protein
MIAGRAHRARPGARLCSLHELADGDAAGARSAFAAAAHLWNEVGAPYETALARMGLGAAHRAEGNQALALLEFRAARSAFEQIGAERGATRAARACEDGRGNDDGEPGVRVQPAPSGTGGRVGQDNVFRREGDYWSVVFEGHTVRLRDSKGLRCLARLMADPGREFHAVDLVVGDGVEPGTAGRAAEPDLRVSGGSDAGRCSMRQPRQPRSRTAGGWSRSSRTPRRRGSKPHVRST